MSPQPKQKPLTVAVTGPTGDIGKAFVRSLGRSQKIGTRTENGKPSGATNDSTAVA